MANKTYMIQIMTLPDRNDPALQITSGGDVLAAIGKAFEHLSRVAAKMAPGSVSLALRLVYQPSNKDGDLQERLGIFLVVTTRDPRLARAMRLQVEEAVSGYFDWRAVAPTVFPVSGMRAACDVARLEQVETPLLDAKDNPSIPPAYYKIEAFETNGANDQLRWVQALDPIKERVAVEICVEPADVATERRLHIQYLALLESINRGWTLSEGDETSGIDYLGAGQAVPSYARPRLRTSPPREPQADEVLRAQRRFHETLSLPQLKFHIRTFAETEAVCHLIGSMVGDSSFKNGSYRLIHHAPGSPAAAELLQARRGAQVRSAPVPPGIFSAKGMAAFAGLRRLTQVATVEELSGALRPPVASGAVSPCCIRKSTDPPPEDPQNMIFLGYDDEIGSCRRAKGTKDVCRGLATRIMPKHVSLFGTPGFWKSSVTQHVAVQLRARDIPFLIIECAKTEYRGFKKFKRHKDPRIRRLARELRVHTPGIEALSPLRFNLLRRDPRISVDEKIANLMTAIQGAIPLSASLPAVLIESLEAVFERFPDPNNPPVLSSWVAAIEQVMSRKGYARETAADIRAALETRLGVLLRGIFGWITQCRDNVPDIGQLLKSYSLIELDPLPRDQACLLALLLLMGIREHVKTNFRSGRGVQFVIFIEEAHLICGRVSDARPSEDNPDPAAFAAEFISRMLVEMRAYGFCFCIIDQHPSRVARSVIESTATKLAFCQLDRADRELLQDTMGLSDWQMQELIQLAPGVAYFFTEGYQRPRRIRTVTLHNQMDMSDPPLREELLPHIQDDPWFKADRRRRLATELSQLQERMNQLDAQLKGLVERAKALIEQEVLVLALASAQRRREGLAQLEAKAAELMAEITGVVDHFRKGPYRRLLGEPAEAAQEPMVAPLRDGLIQRWEGVIQISEEVAGRLGGLVSRYQNSKFKEGMSDGKTR